MTEIKILEIVRSAIEAQQEVLGNGATVKDATCALHALTAADFQSKWRITKNPIWVWKCLARLNAFSVNAINCFPELAREAFGKKIPDWCAEYFLEAAFNIELLASGHDFQDPHAFSEKIGTTFANEVPPKHAPNRLPAALGFVRQGWNAFKQYQGDDFPSLYLVVQELERKTGREPSLTLEDLMDAMGWEDERNAHRKLAELRKRAKPLG